MYVYLLRTRGVSAAPKTTSALIDCLFDSGQSEDYHSPVFEAANSSLHIANLFKAWAYWSGCRSSGTLRSLYECLIPLRNADTALMSISMLFKFRK